MATKSGMNYDKVETLLSDLGTHKDTIINGLEELKEVAPQQIGEAAETYKTALDKTITTISETLDTMIESLRTNTEEKQADYTSQDTKMQESISTGTTA
jgi:vacuolar-type H+-ATPase subunit H